jgi:hypothetical protein
MAMGNRPIHADSQLRDYALRLGWKRLPVPSGTARPSCRGTVKKSMDARAGYLPHPEAFREDR